jgi:hypothetical protein
VHWRLRAGGVKARCPVACLPAASTRRNKKCIHLNNLKLIAHLNNLKVRRQNFALPTLFL